MTSQEIEDILHYYLGDVHNVPAEDEKFHMLVTADELEERGLPACAYYLRIIYSDYFNKHAKDFGGGTYVLYVNSEALYKDPTNALYYSRMKYKCRSMLDIEDYYQELYDFYMKYCQ